MDVPLVLHGGSGLTDYDFKRAIQEGISKVNIFTDINVAAVEAEFRRFNSMDKGIIDLIPAAVEAVKQETSKKMELFGSCGHASDGRGAAFRHADQGKSAEIEKITRAVLEAMKNYSGK